MIAAFDLDGTLCDNSKREHLARAASNAEPWEKNATWDAFHEKILEDEPRAPVLDTLRALRYSGHVIEIWTARPERWRALTIQWLEKNGIYMPPRRLLMRGDNDYRKAYIVKLDWYLHSTQDNKPSIVFEDHPETVRLLRAAGCVVAQVGDRSDVK